MKKIIIFGTGGNCVDILDTINDINRAGKSKKYQCLGFLDDDKSKWGKIFGGAKVLGPLESAQKYKQALFVNGIGSPANFWRKEDIISKTGIKLDRFTTVIHPTASVSKMAHIGCRHSDISECHYHIQRSYRQSRHNIAKLGDQP